MQVALAAVILALLAPVASATPAACRSALVLAASRQAQAVSKAFASCAKRGVADCANEGRTTTALARASARLTAAVTAACCGVDGRCGTADDEPLAAIGWGAGGCPNLDHGDCNMLLGHPGDVSNCLACIGTTAARDTMALARVPDPGPALTACAGALVKEASKLAVTTAKALARCWLAREQGAHTNPCPVPGDGKAGPALDAARSRARGKVCRACGGTDQACGGSDDTSPSTLAFPAECPAVGPPGGPSCDTPIATLADLAACVDCVASHDAQCTGQAAAPAYLAYPAECASPPGVCQAGIECVTAADCPLGYACLDNGSGTTRYCVGSTCADDGECAGGAVCRQYCTFAGCQARRCMCPGFACGADEVCIDDGGLACRQLCTQDSDCPPPLGVCVNSTFGAGLCISSTFCQ